MNITTIILVFNLGPLLANRGCHETSAAPSPGVSTRRGRWGGEGGKRWKDGKEGVGKLVGTQVSGAGQGGAGGEAPRTHSAETDKARVTGAGGINCQHRTWRGRAATNLLGRNPPRVGEG